MTEAIENKKKFRLFPWAILAALLLVLSGAGSPGWEFFPVPRPDAALASEAHGEGEKGGKHVDLMVPLDSFVVNLADPPQTKRYIKVTLGAQMVDEKAVADIQSKKDFVRDGIILLLSSKTSQEVCTVEGKTEIRKEIAEKINMALEGPKVVRVFFTELIIQ
ncbi:MAG: flagellar basal body-associated FliL family protein [Desulfovibrionaceae bacterium]|nr:flagellar basal body-associated FliL family protein [Desulfovibrionaceae bacterium]MBF0514268.1 flagellar basal body-associated FliL family protein [Desulfovibrionaceae bacterium]